MSKRPSPRGVRNTVLTLIVGAIIAFLQWKGWLPDNKSAGSSGSSTRTTPPASGVPSETRRHGQWEELTGCTLIPNRGNDGDSFRVSHGGREIFARLYFVDCPEKYSAQNNRARLADQGRYFGGLPEDATVNLGLAARDFTVAKLEAAPFTIITRGERVYDSERVYVFLTTGQDGADLGELLVARGLARIHTKGESPPGRTEAQEKRKLYELEATARRAKTGGWAGH